MKHRVVLVDKRRFYMKKTFIFLGFLTILVFMTSGCIISKEGQQKKKEVSNIAKQLATEYLKEKYNIEDAEIVDTTVHTGVYQVWPGRYYVDKATVCYKYKDKTVDVYVDILENFISDNYQADKVKEDFVRYIDNYFSHKIIISYESIFISGKNKTMLFSFDKDEYYDGNFENFKQYLHCISFQGFIKNDRLNEESLLKNINDSLDKLIRDFNINNPEINIEIGIHKENVDISKEGENYFYTRNMGSFYEDLNYSYDLRLNPTQLDKTLIRRKDYESNLVAEEFDYRKYMKIHDDFEIPEYKYNDKVIDVSNFRFKSKDTNSDFVEPNFHEEHKKKYEIVYGFFNYDVSLRSKECPNFIWFKYNNKSNIKNLIVLNDYIKPIETFEEHNNIYFRVDRNARYALAVKKGDN